MSSYIQPQMKAFKAETVIEKFRFVKFGSSDEQVSRCGAAEKGFGVYMNQNDNAAIGDCAEVAHLGGGALIELGGTIARGDSIASNATGQGVLATAGQWAPGVAMESGVAGDVISILLDGHQAI